MGRWVGWWAVPACAGQNPATPRPACSQQTRGQTCGCPMKPLASDRTGCAVRCSCVPKTHGLHLPPAPTSFWLCIHCSFNSSKKAVVVQGSCSKDVHRTMPSNQLESRVRVWFSRRTTRELSSIASFRTCWCVPPSRQRSFSPLNSGVKLKNSITNGQ